MTQRHDPVVDVLRAVYERCIAAGRARTRGDAAKTLELLIEAKVELDDLVADLRRELEQDRKPAA